MRTYYELLGIASTAAGEEIKSAFRREIARYHPDKVQHLGQEFQEIAATRAAELTEAYRILMDAQARAGYDRSLGDGTGADRPAGATSPPAASPAAENRGETHAKPGPAAAYVPDSLRAAPASVSAFVRKAAIGRVRDAVAALSGSAESPADSGFDAVFVLRPKRGLFQKSEAPVRIAVKIVEQVDGGAIQAIWPAAVRSPAAVTPCVLLCGTGLAPARELAAAIAEQRRKSRQGSPPVLVPVDTRDWQALIPPDTPGPVRTLLERLKLGV